MKTLIINISSPLKKGEALSWHQGCGGKQQEVGAVSQRRV